jgi:hypothetical protein
MKIGVVVMLDILIKEVVILYAVNVFILVLIVKPRTIIVLLVKPPNIE